MSGRDDELLTSSQVAALLGISPSSVLRTERSRLDYQETPGGPGGKKHRRYRRGEVVRFARDELGIDVPDGHDV